MDRVEITGNVWRCRSDLGEDIADGSFFEYSEEDEEYYPPRQEKNHITAFESALMYLKQSIINADINSQYSMVIKGQR